MARAGPVGGWGLPASAATGNPWGWGCFRIYRPSSMPSVGLGRCDRRHKLLFEYPIIFWTPRGIPKSRGRTGARPVASSPPSFATRLSTGNLQPSCRKPSSIWRMTSATSSASSSAAMSRQKKAVALRHTYYSSGCSSCFMYSKAPRPLLRAKIGLRHKASITARGASDRNLYQGVVPTMALHVAHDMSCRS
jgi:hypothetical protein